MSILHLESLSKTHPEATVSGYLKVLAACVTISCAELCAADPGLKDVSIASTSVSYETSRKVNSLLPDITIADMPRVTWTATNPEFNTARLALPINYTQPRTLRERMEMFAKTQCIDLGKWGTGRGSLRFKAAYVRDGK